MTRVSGSSSDALLVWRVSDTLLVWRVSDALLVWRVSDTTRPPLVLDVTAERARRRELAELVPDHRLGHEYRDVLAAVMHRERVAEHGRHDHRTPGPRLDDVLGALLVLNVDLLLQVVVDERALLEAAWHCSVLLAPLRGLAATDDETVAVLVRPAGTTLRLTPWAHRVAATGRLAFTTAVRV